jgi:hypothetical protein
MNPAKYCKIDFFGFSANILSQFLIILVKSFVLPDIDGPNRNDLNGVLN